VVAGSCSSDRGGDTLFGGRSSSDSRCSMIWFFVDQLSLGHHNFDCMFSWEVSVGEVSRMCYIVPF